MNAVMLGLSYDDIRAIGHALARRQGKAAAARRLPARAQRRRAVGDRQVAPVRDAPRA